jgi:hypothetical protein
MSVCAAGWLVPRRVWLSGLVGLGLLCSLVALRAFSAAPSPVFSSNRGAARSAHGWGSLPVAARLAVSRGLGRDEQQFGVHDAAGGALVARGGGVSGVRVAGRSGGELRLGLAAVGRGGSLRSVGVVLPVVSGSNRVSYSRHGVVEWYASGPLGLEQGFALARRPAGSGALTLAVGALALAGGVQGRLARDGSLLTVLGRAGRGSLSYGDLSVTDALGRHFSARIVLSGARVLLRIDDAGARYPLAIDPLVQEAELTASDGGVSGYSVAVSGNTIVTGSDMNAAYVFTMPASGWANATQTAELTASDGGADDEFGNSVAISGDTIVIGAPHHTVGTNAGQGAAYVFTLPTGGWVNATQTAELTASDGTATAYFGGGLAPDSGVAISGNTIVVGVQDGAVYVFAMPASGWTNATQTAELTATAGATALGGSVAVSGDTIVAGAPELTVGSNALQGALFVFVMPASGWVNATQTAELTASDGGADDLLGYSVAASGDTIVAGAPFTPANTRRGLVYVFTMPAGGWANATQTAELTASDGVAGDQLGYSVAADGDTIIAGAPYHQTLGAAYVYTEPASGWADATQTAELADTNSGAQSEFTVSVGVSGGTLVASAPNDTVGSNIEQGAAYVFGSGSPGSPGAPGSPGSPTTTGSLSVVASAKVSSKGVAGVSLSCAGKTGASCAGKLTLTVGVKTKVKRKVKGHTKAVPETKTVTLGSASYSLPAGKSETLSVKLSGAAVKLLDAASHRKLKVKATAKPSKGSTVTKTMTLTGPPKKKTRKK